LPSINEMRRMYRGGDIHCNSLFLGSQEMRACEHLPFHKKDQ